MAATFDVNVVFRKLMLNTRNTLKIVGDICINGDNDYFPYNVYVQMLRHLK